MADIDKQQTRTDTEINKQKEGQKNNDQAARDIEVARSQWKIDKLDQKSQESVKKIIDELNKLRNDPAMLDKLNDSSLLGILKSHGILVQDIKNILDMMAKQDHQRDMAQIGAGEVSRVPEIIQWNLGGLQEAYNRLWVDLQKKLQEANPENQVTIAGFTREVKQAEDQTRELGVQLNALV